MPSYVDSFRINGLIDPTNNVLDNINKLADAALIWVQYDATTGKWGASFNDTDTSVYSFNDNNILGGITVSGTGLSESYNKVSVEYPHKDIRDQTDFVDVSIPLGDRFDNEIDNTLNLKLDLVNNPVQAQYIATVELKSSRLDKIIEFRTDYTGITFIAGVLIDVTSSQYGFSSKLFRVTKVEEIDNDDGSIEFQITAIEYDANVYSTAGLVYEARSRASGIKPKIANTEIKEMDDRSSGTDLLRLLGLNMATGLLNSALTKNATTGKVTQTVTPTSAGRDATLSKIRTTPITPAITGPTDICEGSNLVLTLDYNCAGCLFESQSYSYTITGVTAPDITPFSLTGSVTIPGTMTIPIANDGIADNETLTLTIGGETKSVIIRNRLSYTYSTSASASTISPGESTTITLTTTGVANGTVIPYVITGDTSNVTTTLTGTVTVNSNSATLSIESTTDIIYNSKYVTVSFTAPDTDYCGQIDSTETITITYDGSCGQKVSIPVVWCPTYGIVNFPSSPSIIGLQSLKPIKFAIVDRAKYNPATGEHDQAYRPYVTVPTKLTVTQNYSTNKSVISYDSNNYGTGAGSEAVRVDLSNATKAGILIDVFTQFDQIDHNKYPGPPPTSNWQLYETLTGTLVTVKGYT